MSFLIVKMMMLTMIFVVIVMCWYVRWSIYPSVHPSGRLTVTLSTDDPVKTMPFDGVEQDGQPLVTSFPEAEAEIRRLKEELALSQQQNGEGGDGLLIQQMESRENEKNNKIKSIEKTNKNLKLEKDKIHK